VDAAPRPHAPPASAGRGRHFLSPRIAADLVKRFDIRRDDLVVEIGAGSGRLTRELAHVAGLVLAIEVDDRLARRLVRATSSWSNVYVHGGDAETAAFPPTPFRTVGNIPFSISTAILRRVLEDPSAQRIDLILQHEMARKRARPRGTVLSVLWHTTWHLEVRGHIPGSAFHPPPSVDAAWLTGTRRSTPLIAGGEMHSFERFVRKGFAKAELPIARSLGLRSSVIRRGGVQVDARAIDLDAKDWVAIFRANRG
jgi:23S rRNA (adenine-N6)-dimethyltransferase